ncbi:MAG: VTT domain-containing protein [Acidobacteria bacterium]|nr:VTT domain-containing protein [Acidobacteriota bacterium]
MGKHITGIFSGYGGVAVLLLAIADSSFLSFPEGNDLLIVILSTGGSWGNMAYFVGLTVTGSVIGCLLLYSVGRKGGRAILKKKFSNQKIERAEDAYRKYGILAVLIPSVLPPPLPFKIFVLSAGVFGLAPYRFLTAVAIGRSIRYSMWGILAVLYGNSVKLFLQENISTVGTALLAVLVLIITGTVVLHLRRKKRRRELDCLSDNRQ